MSTPVRPGPKAGRTRGVASDLRTRSGTVPEADARLRDRLRDRVADLRRVADRVVAERFDRVLAVDQSEALVAAIPAHPRVEGRVCQATALDVSGFAGSVRCVVWNTLPSM